MSEKERNLQEIAERLRELREISGYTLEQAASLTEFSVEEFTTLESGSEDFPYSFLLKCSEVYGVSIFDLLEGASQSHLTGYTVTRSGSGKVAASKDGHIIADLAAKFRDRIARPYLVRYAYDETQSSAPIELDTHSGQEFDYVVSGSLRVQIGSHVEVLTAGDSIYYDSGKPHGMVATGGTECVFLAVVLTAEKHAEEVQETVLPLPEYSSAEPLYREFTVTQEDETGRPTQVAFKNTERFNFAFDVVDRLADKCPDKLCMLHVDRTRQVRRFTYQDMSKLSSRAANYLLSVGIKRGDRVMLVLKRNWQFWVVLCALHKIGAVMVPAPDQLLQHDFEYRFESGQISALITTGESNAYLEAEKAFAKCPDVAVRVMVNGTAPGWLDFDTEFLRFRSSFDRDENSPGGADELLMFFSSGTTGYPKLVTHSHLYPLGHFATARYWQRVDPNGIHFTISDTGWGKALWGKIYGQWLCEAAIFVYDFDRFDAAQVLPMFKEFNITTFCAPPTIYRFLIKDDLSQYDLSTIKHATTAGEALNPEVFYRFRDATGLSVMEGFGQTETTLLIGNFTGMSPRVGSMGVANPQYNLDVVDADGNSLPAGETGEIVVRFNEDGSSPAGLFLKYSNDEKKTAEAWTHGFYHTGDTAWRDEEGFFWYVGRVDDVIKSSGYRIGPFEIESVIMELPYVLECGVSAAPDEVRGQVVKASIVLVKGKEPSDELAKEIQNYVKTHTAPYKYPRIVVFRDELPKTINGKIQRNQL
ncbi:MAG: AMP-binding protein [Oscillospiraceae bacterium]|jgi:acetyl-CoA synthetase|nr:AMP-binding protein [Oscillospiraceae bacterium]